MKILTNSPDRETRNLELHNLIELLYSDYESFDTKDNVAAAIRARHVLSEIKCHVLETRDTWLVSMNKYLVEIYVIDREKSFFVNPRDYVFSGKNDNEGFCSLVNK